MAHLLQKMVNNLLGFPADPHEKDLYQKPKQSDYKADLKQDRSTHGKPSYEATDNESGQRGSVLKHEHMS